MKKKIDIEKLLQWAICDELPKGRSVSSSIGAAVMTAGKAQRSNAMVVRDEDDDEDFVPGYVPGEPMDDAVRVAMAVRQLPTSARAAAVRADAIALLGEFALIAGDAIDALTHTIVNPRALVISHAFARSRPAWEFGNPRCEAIKIARHFSDGRVREYPLVEGYDDDGALVALSANRGRRAKRNGLYDLDRSPRAPLNWFNPEPLRVGEARAEYFAWHSALAALAHSLAGALEKFDVLPPAAARPAPWFTGQNDPRVLSDVRGAGVKVLPGLPLHPKRHAPGKPIESAIVENSRPRPDVIRWAKAKKRIKQGLI